MPTAEQLSSTRSAYFRILGYALHYRLRIIAMMLLSLVVGASLGSVIFTAGTAVSILFGSDDEFARQQERLTGRVQSMSNKAHGLIAHLPKVIGDEVLDLAPHHPAERAGKLLEDMKANRSVALRIIVASLIAFTLLNGFARYLLEYYAAALGLNVSIRLNREMYDNLLNLSSRFYDQRSAGEMVSRFVTDSYLVNLGMADVFTRMLREPARAAFMLVVAMSVDIYLTLIVITLIAPLVFVIMIIGKKVKTTVLRSLERVATISSMLNETVRGISIVKIFRMEAYERRRMEQQLNQLRKQRKRLARADAAVAPLTEIVIVFALGTFLLIAEYRHSQGLLAAGDIFTLLLALAGMLEPMRLLSKMPNLIQTSAASAARVFEFIDYKPDVEERTNARTIGPLRDAIRFEDVHFAYVPGQDVLRGASFEVPRGKMVALVGFSGAGKSTVVKLLPRFYDVAGGRITLDGVDIRDATFESLRGQIGMVTQETVLFTESIRVNIAAGAESPDETRVRAAARAAHADVFVEPMPGAYDTSLTGAGANLSGGQRQRVAIARAIYKDAPILILDEATSSLDSESEKAILDALDHFVQGRTTLVIAHRLSTILKADKIVVLDGGKVVDEGMHAELIARDGLYRRLYRLQFAGEAEPLREAGAK